MALGALWLLMAFQAADPSAEGIKALDARDYQAAERAFARAVEADPKDYGALFHLALSHSLLQKEAEAIADYRKVLELKPGLYEAELNLGILLLQQKQVNAALPLLRSAAEKKPQAFRPRLYCGEALLQSGSPAQAEDRFRAALTTDPKSAAAELGLGRSQARQGRLSEASGHFRKAAELDGGYKDALLELASLYEAAKQPDEAMAIYQQFPGSAAAQERMAILFVETKRYADAIVRLEQAVAADPTLANQLALANAYRLNKEEQKALPVLAKVAAAEPKNYDVRMLYGAMLRDQKQFAPAAREFLGAAQVRPDSKEAWNELAGMFILLESFPQALAALDRVKALGGEMPAHHFFRAIILDKTKQYKPALEQYQRFLALSEGKFPDEEFKSRQRVRIIQKELNRR